MGDPRLLWLFLGKLWAVHDLTVREPWVTHGRPMAVP